jgi:hypothetical protein
MKVYNSAALLEERKANAAKIKNIVAYRGSAKANLEDTSGRLAVNFKDFDAIDTVNNMAEMASLRHRIISKYKSAAEVEQILRNAASAPAPADIEAFFGRFYLDVTRRAMEGGDLTPLIAHEVTNPNFPKLVYKRDLLKYRGVMGKISGENDKPNMIEQNGGEVATMGLYIMGLGWKDSIGNQLWNEFFTMEQVIQAAADAYTDYRNSVTVGSIVGTTFVASQKQAAIANGSGETKSFDELVYETILAGTKKLRGLIDPQTKRKIAVPEIRWLGNSANTWDLENVIRGQLNANGGGARGANRPSLPIGMLLEYDRGINDGFTIGKKTQSIPGVTVNKGYLFVPDVALVANKRGLTTETGQGSVIDFATQERSWYCVQGEDLGDLLGSSASTPVGGAAGYGAIVEVTLPS